MYVKFLSKNDCQIIIFVLIDVSLFPAVQQERKPPENRDKIPVNIATSTQKIYIRKDLSSSSPSVPFFVSSYQGNIFFNSLESQYSQKSDTHTYLGMGRLY